MSKNMIKKILSTLIGCLFVATITMACSDNTNDDSKKPEAPDTKDPQSVAKQNLERSIQLADNTFTKYFVADGTAMARFYNPYTSSVSGEKASVWMYTSSIEAVNAILAGLQAQKNQGDATLYDKHFSRYSDLLSNLYTNLDYYMGTYTLTSFTQEKSWSIYGVNRANEKGQANVSGIENVYDDQMWLIREMIEAYKLTGKAEYLKKAEYLTSYVLDGWDTTRDENGNENGGIPWGPGYVTKHACSNGPIVSPLVWLHELYAEKSDEIEYRYIDATDKKTRKSEIIKKSNYYLNYAKKIYQWQKETLMMSEGVFFDMRGGCEPSCDVAYEYVNQVKYRKNTRLTRSEGTAYSYNTGTMISGATDLYRVTKDATYLADAKRMGDDSFKYFAGKGKELIGYYTYDVSGFNNWFNGVLMRSYVELYPSYINMKSYINSFQQNLDYGYENFQYEGLLPVNLLSGWENNKNDNNIEGMFMFTFAAEYAILSKYELENNK